MRAVFSGRSSRRWSSVTSTAAIPAAALPASGVLTQAPVSGAVDSATRPAIYFHHVEEGEIHLPEREFSSLGKSTFL